MKQSQLFTKIRREAPADEESKNAELLIRAGFVHKEAAGVYSLLPLGLRVREKIENIIREEMNALGGQEVHLSTLQDKALWEKTGRWSDAAVDNWFKAKGKPVFMSHKERKEIIEALECVDEVIISGHKKNTKDISVCRELLRIKPHIFANGGDRKPEDVDIPSSEYKVCKELGIEVVFNVGKGGKIRSSSELLREYSKRIKK